METSVRPPRLLLALLAASLVVTGLAVAAGLVRAGVPRPVASPAPPPAGRPSAGPAVPPGAVPAIHREAVHATSVLHRWDARRARAWARGDVAALGALYVAGSRAGGARRGDAAGLGAPRAAGARRW